MILFNKKYSDESLVDAEEDLSYAILENCMDIPLDENGFHIGTFTVTLTWENENAI